MTIKRGQAAMEFLMTYGWAILAVIVVIGVLVAYGFFNPSRLTQETYALNAPFNVRAAVVTGGAAGSANVQLDIINGAGEDITLQGISISGCGNSDPSSGTGDAANIGADNLQGAGTHAMNSGAQEIMILTCSSAITVGNLYKGDIALTYTKSGSSLNLQSTGSVVSKAR